MGKNWNDMSDDSSEDSWFDDDQTENPKPEEKQESPPSQESKKQPEKVTQPSQAKKFMGDDEILKQYQDGKIDQPKTIKVICCYSQQCKEVIGQLRLSSKKEIKQGYFILNFVEEGDLIKFIKDKIANRYKFYLQPFFSSKKPVQEKKRESKKYQREERPRGDKRQPRHEKQHKKVFVAKEEAKQYEIVKNKSEVIIFSNHFDESRLLKELQEKNIYGQYTKIKFITPLSAFDKVSLLCMQISKTKKFNLTKTPSKEKDPAQLLLQQNFGSDLTKQFYKSHQKPVVKEETEILVRPLGAEVNNYFAQMKKWNKSEIIEQFNSLEYLKRLRENTKQIEKNYSKWFIQAQDDFISQLLLLSFQIKKKTFFEVELKPGMRNQKALLVAVLRYSEEKEKRPKVDASSINAYLT